MDQGSRREPLQAALQLTLLTPIARDDLHRLITRMDDVMDFLEAATEWKEIYELLETATDRCEDAANTIEGIVLEHR